jgi:hypothetical protein
VTGLTDFQADVARLFFSVPASDGFLLAGGGALLASGLTSRPTEDLDFFGDREHVDIAAARDQFESAVAGRGWQSTRVQDGASFVRLRVTGDDEVIVDPAIDTPAGRPRGVSIVGPTFDPEELAGRKLIALFDRAEARDFVDVYMLAQRFGRATLLQRAAEVDLGLDRAVLATMLRSLDRFSDDELPIDAFEVVGVRAYFEDWAGELAR